VDVRRKGIEVRRRLGYLAGELALYEQLTAREMLRDLARLRGGVDNAQLAERFGLPLEKPIRELSKGNKRKVGLIQAFMHRPESSSSTSRRAASTRCCAHVPRARRRGPAQGTTVLMSSRSCPSSSMSPTASR
jgi:hypothetical protein